MVVVVVLALLREQNCTSFNGASLSLPIVVFIMRLRSPSRTPWYPSPPPSFSWNRALSLSPSALDFFLLAYPEDFLRRAMRFCYINIGSISKRTPFYQSSPLPPFFVLLLWGREARGQGGNGCTTHEIYANWNGMSRIRWKLFNVDNVIRNRSEGGCVRVRMSDISGCRVKSSRCSRARKLLKEIRNFDLSKLGRPRHLPPRRT